MKLAMWLCLPLLAMAEPPRLVEWERGLALQAQENPNLRMYLWFYE